MSENPKERPEEEKISSLPAEVESTVAAITRNNLSGTMHATDSAESAKHILTREDVLQEMDRYAKEYVIQRELLDEYGLLLLEIIRTTDDPQEVIEYTYRRKGMYGKHQVDRTTIEMTIYDDGMPESGSVISEYDEATKAWTPRAIEFADSIQAELERNMRKVEGIIIPKRYVPVPAEIQRNPTEMKRLHTQIRWFRYNFPFLCNDDDPDFVAFMNRCKQQTNELRNALQKEFESRGMNFWALSKKPNAANEQKQRISFLIRPPFLASNADKTKGKRMKQRDHEFSFVLHFDEANAFDRMRCWNLGSVRDMIFSNAVTESLQLKAEDMEKSFGDWGRLSSIVADSVEEFSFMLKKTWPS